MILKQYGICPSKYICYSLEKNKKKYIKMRFQARTTFMGKSNTAIVDVFDVC